MGGCILNCLNNDKNEMVDTFTQTQVDDPNKIKIKHSLGLDKPKFDYLEDMSNTHANLIMSFHPSLSVSDDSVLLTASCNTPDDMQRVKWRFVHFHVLQILHRGYASIVYLCKCLKSDREVVLKRYILTEMSDLERLHLFREITIHSRLKHDYIVDFYVSFQEGDSVFIVLEFLRGNTLANVLKMVQIKERMCVNSFIIPILDVVEYLHGESILHRDLKPENIIITKDGKPKLLDFGLTIDLKTEIANTRAGTLPYMAPEVLMCKTKRYSHDYNKLLLKTQESEDDIIYTTKSDIWAIGIFVYELFTGRTPFQGRTDDDTVDRIANNDMTFPHYFSPQLISFIRECLEWNPNKRASIYQLKNHLWIQTLKIT